MEGQRHVGRGWVKMTGWASDSEIEGLAETRRGQWHGGGQDDGGTGRVGQQVLLYWGTRVRSRVQDGEDRLNSGKRNSMRGEMFPLIPVVSRSRADQPYVDYGA